ncbi:peptidoglycan-binding protein, partial [Streptomyces sp. NPDC058613]|uniref:peptidoglycan-binding domain-containing protein n=1 Tax=Streptomyces sp. NPDC058613 TaxID=3346556 RepID=UPI00364D3FB1
RTPLRGPLGPPGLSVPVLPQRNPGAAADDPVADDPTADGPATGAAPEATPSTRATPAPAGTASSSPAPSPSGSRDPKPPPSASAAPRPADDGTLRPGDRGAEVRALQQRLHGQGFTYVTVNGVYDAQTRRGVAQLQSDRGIEGDPKGIYGPATQAAFD